MADIVECHDVKILRKRNDVFCVSFQVSIQAVLEDNLLGVVFPCLGDADGTEIFGFDVADLSAQHVEPQTHAFLLLWMMKTATRTIRPRCTIGSFVTTPAAAALGDARIDAPHAGALKNGYRSLLYTHLVFPHLCRQLLSSFGLQKRLSACASAGMHSRLPAVVAKARRELFSKPDTQIPFLVVAAGMLQSKRDRPCSLLIPRQASSLDFFLSTI